MFPVYMKEDKNFRKFYEHIDNIFTQIEETVKSFYDSLGKDANIDSKPYLKLLSVFGQTEEFHKEGPIVKGIYYENNVWHKILAEDTHQLITFKFSSTVLYFCSKFNTLKNNFSGSFINLKESLANAFSVEKDFVAFESEQSILSPSPGNDLDRDMTMLTINIKLSPELVNRFPTRDAWGDTNVWNIDYIDEQWVNDPAHPEHLEKYNFYKSFLELLTLLINNYFSLNILGVLTEFEISGQAPVLKWNESNFNEALWSGTISSQ